MTSSAVPKDEQVLCWKELLFCVLRTFENLIQVLQLHCLQLLKKLPLLCCGRWAHLVDFCSVLCVFGKGPGGLLYSQSFLFLAIDLGHCQTVAWQRAAYMSFRIESRPVGQPFCLASFSLLYVSSLLASWFVVVTLRKKAKHSASFRIRLCVSICSESTEGKVLSKFKPRCHLCFSNLLCC